MDDAERAVRMTIEAGRLEFEIEDEFGPGAVEFVFGRDEERLTA